MKNSTSTDSGAQILGATQSALDCAKGAGNVLVAKLSPPFRSKGTIDRPRLLSLLEIDVNPITLIDAPAGYGKTTLASQWAEVQKEKGVIVAWLSLDQSDRQPVQFAMGLAAALSVAGISKVDPIIEELSGGANVQQALVAMLNSLQAIETQRICLILDDINAAASPEVETLMRLLLRGFPDQHRLTLISRGAPAIGVSDLLVVGKLRRIDASALKYTLEELRAYLPNDIEDEQAKNIFLGTEGWPLAIYLIALLEASGELRNTTPIFHGIASPLTDYLTESVIQKLDEEMQRFLMETAALEYFDVELVRDVCGFSDPWRKLEALQAASLFVESADASGEWFRYHTLFSAFLIERLRRERPGRAEEIYRNAARWFAARGHLSRATRMARLADDLELAAQLLEQDNTWQYMLSYGCEAFEGLESLSMEALERTPKTAISIVYTLVQRGEIGRARRKYNALSAIIGEQNDPAGGSYSIQHRLMGMTLDMYEDSPVDSAAAEEVERIISADPNSGRMLRLPATILLIYAYANEGRLRDAEAVAARVIDEAPNIAHLFAGGWGLTLCAIISIARNNLSDALEALDYVDENFDHSTSQHAVSDFLKGVISIAHGDANTAKLLFQDTLDLMEPIFPWFDAAEAVHPAQAALLADTSGPDAAIAYIRSGLRKADRYRLHRISRLFILLEIEFYLRFGEYQKAKSATTCDEFRGLIDATFADPRYRRIQLRALLIEARLLEIDGLYDKALNTIKRALATIDATGCEKFQLPALAMRAAMLRAIGDESSAVRQTKEILTVAEKECILSWVDHMGPAAAHLIRASLTELEPVPETAISALAQKALKRCASLYGNAEPGPLSPREFEVLGYLREGLSSKEMADVLGISDNTVRGYRKSLFVKLQVHTRAQAIAAGRNLRLIK